MYTYNAMYDSKFTFLPNNLLTVVRYANLESVRAIRCEIHEIDFPSDTVYGIEFIKMKIKNTWDRNQWLMPVVLGSDK